MCIEDQFTWNKNNPTASPEILLAREFKDELGVDINPQALRIFIRMRWNRIASLAHKIHDAS